MITKATVERVLDSKTYQVRIPIIDKTEKSSLSNNALATAVVSSQINSPLNYRVGDVVFVDFEENNYGKPVILGMLYSNTKSQSKPDVLLNSIEVEESANLPSNIKIGKDIKYENILSLKNSRENIQKQINNLLAQLSSYKESLEDKASWVSLQYTSIKEAETLLEKIDNYLQSISTTIGNESDNNETTVYGKLNSLSLSIDSMLKKTGTINEDTTFFDRLQDIESRLSEIFHSAPITRNSSNNDNDYEQPIIRNDDGDESESGYIPSVSSKFDDLLNALRSKFPDGKYWNHMPHTGTGNAYNNQDGWTNIPCTKHNNYCGTSKQTCNGYAPNGYETSWQCRGYANKCGFDMTGYDPETSPKWKKTTDVNYLKKVKKGDIIRYKGHSVYVIKVDGNMVYFTDCNSDGHCQIKWTRGFEKSHFKKEFEYIRISPTDFSMSRLLSATPKTNRRNSEEN